jgi:hypothetical protein
MNDGGLENMWLMDSGCSRHMTEDAKWFSNLTPMQNKEYVTFGDDKKGKVKTKGIIKVNEHLFLGIILFVCLILVEIWFVAFLSV